MGLKLQKNILGATYNYGRLHDDRIYIILWLSNRIETLTEKLYRSWRSDIFWICYHSFRLFHYQRTIK